MPKAGTLKPENAVRALIPLDNNGGFVFLKRQACPVLVGLLADGDLREGDVVVLLQLLLRIHNRSGKARASIRSLAAETGSSKTTVAHSVRRLRRAGLVVKGEGPHSRPASYFISPVIGTNGSWSERSRSEWMFSLAMRNSPPPAPVTPAAVRHRHALAKHLPEAS